ncbi:MAG: hypothetical protein KIT82_19305, partial [Bradyrhizobium sp.]|nr:hypothetical protein [Bradyrhizobium sp.]
EIEERRYIEKLALHSDARDDGAIRTSVLVGSTNTVALWMQWSDEPFAEQLRIPSRDNGTLALGFSAAGETFYTLNLQAQTVDEWSIFGLGFDKRVLEPARVTAVAYDPSARKLRSNQYVVTFPKTYHGEFLKGGADTLLGDEVGLSVNGDWLVSWDGTQVAVGRDAEELKPFTRPSVDIARWFMAPDRDAKVLAFGRCTISACTVGKINRSELEAGAWPTGRSVAGAVKSVAIDADGLLVAIGGREGEQIGMVTVFQADRQDPNQWRVVFQNPLPGEVSAIAINGGRLAAAATREVRVWDVGRQQLTHRVLNSAPVTALGLSEDGQHLVISVGPPQSPIIPSQNDFVSDIHLLDAGSLVALACGRLPRKGLTPAEWMRYMGDIPLRQTCRLPS